jgi:3-methyl-2-oxobutanoate hydroxymethyltransferase
MKKLTTIDILHAKGKRRLTRILADSYEMAKACEAAGIEMLSVRAAHLTQVRRGAPNTFITAANPRGTYNVSDEEAIKSAFTLLNEGADAVYMCSSLDRIKAVAREGIAVEGHVGLIPALLTWIGGYRAVGKTAAEALKVYRDTLALQEAGAAFAEMEVVPARIAAEIARRVKISVVSLGSGAECDCIYLFGCDVLGTHSAHYPRHAKKYRSFYGESIEAFREFKADVLQGAFPEKKHLVEINPDEVENFLKQVDSIPGA